MNLTIGELILLVCINGYTDFCNQRSYVNYEIGFQRCYERAIDYCRERRRVDYGHVKWGRKKNEKTNKKRNR